MQKQHTIYGPLVHATGVHGVGEHSARRVPNMKNGQKYPKMRTIMVEANVAHVRLGPQYVLNLDSSPMCPTYLLDVDQTPLDLGMVGFTSEPMILH